MPESTGRLAPSNSAPRTTSLLLLQVAFRKLRTEANLHRSAQRLARRPRNESPTAHCARSDSITKMLDLVENTSHLIQKEQMVHAGRAKLKGKK